MRQITQQKKLGMEYKVKIRRENSSGQPLQSCDEFSQLCHPHIPGDGSSKWMKAIIPPIYVRIFLLFVIVLAVTILQLWLYVCHLTIDYHAEYTYAISV